MNVKKYATVLGILVMMASFAVAGPPYTIDGDISDWGVTPFSDWIPDSPTAEYEEHDYSGPGTGITYTDTTRDPPITYTLPHGGEYFDIEALYFDDYYSQSTGGMAYITSVVSMPPGGLGGYFMGDMAIDTDNDGSTGEYGYEYGIKILDRNGSVGDVCYMPNWHKPTDIWGLAPAYFTCDGPSSVYMGKATVRYEDAGIKDFPAGCTGPVDGSLCVPNYIIEVGVKKVKIGMPEKGDVSELHLTQSCGNDDISLRITWDYDLPEFVSLSVPLLILLLAPGLAYVFVRKRSN